MKVLVAEDDRNIREGLRQILRAEGYDVVLAEDGKKALELYEKERPDFVLLDIMMPGEDGYSVCRKIRARNSHLPVIFISAKSEEIDKVVGLELGADDFITKPFGVKEVAARIRAVTRRALSRAEGAEGAGTFRIGDLEVLSSELRARRGGETIDLSLRETKLLRLFADHPGEVLTRDRISDEIWGHDHIPNSRALDQAISQLRAKIESDPGKPAIITTVHAAGYRGAGTAK